MKKICVTIFAAFSCLIAFTQTTAPTKDWKKNTLDRSGDHFMISLTSDNWANVPDSISSHMKGLSRGLGFAFMLDKPFKSNPRFSIAFGLGISSSSIFFKNMSVGLAATGSKLPFINLDSADRFKKYKLVTVFAEIPVELRYVFSPEKEGKSWKVAIGAKVGTMLNAHTKGKTLQNKAGNTINSYTLKESKRSFLNSTRLVATARVGIGSVSLIANYQINALIKETAGPDVRPYQIGICISGL